MVSAGSVETVLTEIGFGRWQGYIMFVALIAYIVGPVQQLGSTLLSAPVPFRCSYPDYIQLDNLTNIVSDEHQIGQLNVSKAGFPSKCLPTNDLMAFDKPPNYDVSKTSLSQHATGLPSCPEIEYDSSVFESTVISEWDLVCERSSLRPLYQMMFSVGSLLSSTFCGQLSDWLGRKRTFQIGAILTLSAVVATSIVPWYSAMLFMRILSGAGTILMVFPSYTLLSEISPINHRTITALCPGTVYFLALPVFAGIAYLVPNWRRLLLLCNTPLLLLIPLSFTMDESPRWLLQRGRRKEAVALLRKAAKQNGVTLTPSTSLLIDSFSQVNSDTEAEQQRDDEEIEGRNQGSLRMLRTCFTSPGMRTILIISPLMMFLKRSLHIGVLLNANNFTSTNPFEYIAMSGAMGVVAIVLSIPISQRLGRRVIIGGALFIGGALMLLELPVPSDYWWAKLIMVMTSFAIVCAAFQVTFVFRAELFPTVIRTRGFTFTNLAGALGEMGIPLVTEIAVLHQWWAASVTFGLTGIIGSFLLPLLPETKDRPMPETLQDVEDRYWNDSKRRGSIKKNAEDEPNGESDALQV